MRILLSRTDSIGDVVLSLPMAGFIKQHLPDAEVHFLGRTYTKPVIHCCEHVDEFLNWDDLEKENKSQQIECLKTRQYDACIHVFPNRDVAALVKEAGIPVRIGTTGRFFHWKYCNKLVRFTRRRSNLHEAQLNLKLLKPLGVPTEASLENLSDLLGFTRLPLVEDKVTKLISKDKVNVILHPKSKGSAVEWGLENFAKLIELLPEDRFQIFISGTEEDQSAIGDSLPFHRPNVTSLLGKLSLDEFIAFISISDALIAASTGPLHIAAALGKRAIGLYSSRKPIHPGRWAPIGLHAKALVFDEHCEKCAQGKFCLCIQDIRPEKLAQDLISSFEDRF